MLACCKISKYLDRNLITGIKCYNEFFFKMKCLCVKHSSSVAVEIIIINQQLSTYMFQGDARNIIKSRLETAQKITANEPKNNKRRQLWQRPVLPARKACQNKMSSILSEKCRQWMSMSYGRNTVLQSRGSHTTSSALYYCGVSL